MLADEDDDIYMEAVAASRVTMQVMCVSCQTAAPDLKNKLRLSTQVIWLLVWRLRNHLWRNSWRQVDDFKRLDRTFQWGRWKYVLDCARSARMRDPKKTLGAVKLLSLLQLLQLAVQESCIHNAAPPEIT